MATKRTTKTTKTKTTTAGKSTVDILTAQKNRVACLSAAKKAAKKKATKKKLAALVGRVKAALLSLVGR